MSLCLDASFVVAAFMPDPTKPAARRFLFEAMGKREPLVAPPLLYAETTSVLRRLVHHRVLLHAEALATLTDLFTASIATVETEELYPLALDLARRLGHAKAYDTQYMAVASLEGCPVVTLDSGLAEAARRLGIPATLIA